MRHDACGLYRTSPGKFALIGSEQVLAAVPLELAVDVALGGVGKRQQHDLRRRARAEVGAGAGAGAGARARGKVRVRVPSR